nr:hypothetical protein Iba_chr03cCG2640 [Ipomoea batatas]
MLQNVLLDATARALPGHGMLDSKRERAFGDAKMILQEDQQGLYEAKDSTRDHASKDASRIYKWRMPKWILQGYIKKSMDVMIVETSHRVQGHEDLSAFLVSEPARSIRSLSRNSLQSCQSQRMELLYSHMNRLSDAVLNVVGCRYIRISLPPPGLLGGIAKGLDNEVSPILFHVWASSLRIWDERKDSSHRCKEKPRSIGFEDATNVKFQIEDAWRSAEKDGWHDEAS